MNGELLYSTPCWFGCPGAVRFVLRAFAIVKGLSLPAYRGADEAE